MIDDGHHICQTLAGTRTGDQDVVVPASSDSDRFFLVTVQAEWSARTGCVGLDTEYVAAFAVEDPFGH